MARLTVKKLLRLLSKVIFSGIFCGGFLPFVSFPLHKIDKYPSSGRMMVNKAQSWHCTPACFYNASSHCSPIYPIHFPSNLLGKEESAEESLLRCILLTGRYNGFTPSMIQGTPQNPYGDHNHVNCIGADMTHEDDHCKSSGDGIPCPLFRFFKLLVSKSLTLESSSCNPGYNDSYFWRSDENAIAGGRTAPTDLMHHNAMPQLEAEDSNDLIIPIPLCSKDCVCNPHDRALRITSPIITLAASFASYSHPSLCPKLQFQGGYIYNLICPAMDLSPAELRLEQELQHMRSELDSGEARENRDRQRALWLQIQLSATELQGYRHDTNRRSRSPILRRTRRQLNRLMRGADEEAAPPQPGPLPVPKEPMHPPPWHGVRPALQLNLDRNLLGMMVPKTPPKQPPAPSSAPIAPKTPPLLSPISGDGMRKRRRSHRRHRSEPSRLLLAQRIHRDRSVLVS